MYKPFTLFIILSVFTLCYTEKSRGQVQVDSIPNSQAIANTISFFNHAIGKQSRVYNGIGNDPYPSNIEGNAFFMDAMVKGSVVFEGNLHNNIPLAYDIYADLVVSYFSDGYSPYSFLKEKISAFDLSGHHFIHLSPDSANRKVLVNTFYDVLYDHRLQVLAHHVKVIQPGSLYNNNSNSQISIQHFEPKVHYYLRKDGLYYQVDNEGSFIDVLKDRKKELKKYLKENKIKFNKDPGKTMQLLAGYYEQLTN